MPLFIVVSINLYVDCFFICLNFEKIKAHAAVIAEEIASPFQCNEVPLDTASQEDLNLIGAGIDSEEQVDGAGDWTFQLNINLRNCVKVKKSSSSKKVQHLLTLGGLSCNATPVSIKPCLNWPSRKIRSRRQAKHVLPSKQSSCIKAVEDVKTKLGQPVVLNVDNILQYSRRKYKHHSCGGIGGLADTNNFILQDIRDINHVDPNSTAKSMTISTATRIENGGDGSSGPCASAAEDKSETLHDHRMLLPTGAFVGNYPPSDLANSPVTSLPVIVNAESQAAVCSLNEQRGKDKFENSCHDSLAHEVTGSGGSIEEKVLNLENFDDSPKAENGICRAIENETLTDKQAIDVIVAASKNDFQVAENDLEGPRNIQSDGNDMLEESSGRADSSESLKDCLPPSWDKKQEESFADQLVIDNAMLKASCSGEPEDIQANGDNQHEGVSRFTELVNESVSVLAEELQAPCNTHDIVESCSDSDNNGSLQEKRESDDSNSTMAHSRPNAKTGNKRKREIDLQTEDQPLVGGFIKSPCEGLRSRTRKDANHEKNKKKRVDVTVTIKKLRKTSNDSVSRKDKKEIQKGHHKCDLDGCSMSFQTKAELLLHKGNRCPVEGCRKKFNSHKYAIQHQRVHDDDRPLKCPWNGCTMSFKWAWARTEHLRVHTGERPYVCKVEGCGLTFRFVSDFSRHRRKTGHYVCTTS